MYGKGKKLSKFKIQNQSEDNKINSIRNSFILKKKKKDKKKKLGHFLKKQIITN